MIHHLDRRFFQISILLSIWVILGCSTGAPEHRPNVILISIDTLRADALGCYGDPAIRTPVMDAMSRCGLLYTDHHVNSNWTLPSHVSIFTSQYAAKHRIVYDNRPLPDSAVTIAEVFQSAGYRTGGFYSIHYFAPELNLRQGFDEMEFYDWVDGADWDRMAQWLNTESDRPYFLFLHTFEPHAPYGGYREYRDDPDAGNLRGLEAFDAFTQQIESGNVSPDWHDFREGMLMMILGFRKGPDRHDASVQQMVQRMTDAQLRLWKDVPEIPISPVLDPWFESEYYAPDTGIMTGNYARRVMFSDRALGRLMRMLKQSGRLDETVVCITSDHGEAFFEHGRVYGHGGNRRDIVDPHRVADTNFHYEEVAVPWILYPANSKTGNHLFRGLTSSLDIMPTLLNLAGLPIPGSAEGQSVLREVPRDRFTVVENQRTRKRALITSGWKFIVGGTEPELYHRGLDPGETVNFSGRFVKEEQRLRDRFNAWSDGRNLTFTADDAPLNPDVREQLQLLGYLSDPDEK